MDQLSAAYEATFRAEGWGPKPLPRSPSRSGYSPTGVPPLGRARQMVFYVILRGPLGVGKTSVALRLSIEIPAKHVAIDRILEERNLEEWADGYISERSFLRVNEVAAEEARPWLEQGTAVVFDGNFYWRSVIEDLIRRLEFPHEVYTLHAPLDVCAERDRGRTVSYGWEAARDVYTKSTAFDFGVMVDANRPLGDVVAEIVRRLPRTIPPPASRTDRVA